MQNCNMPKMNQYKLNWESIKAMFIFLSDWTFTAQSTLLEIYWAGHLTYSQLFLGKLGPLSGWPILVHILLPVTTVFSESAAEGKCLLDVALCLGLMTHGSFCVVSQRKGRKEIEEEMKEMDREERGKWKKVKEQKK